jgi:hypothetical protein
MVGAGEGADVGPNVAPGGKTVGTEVGVDVGASVGTSEGAVESTLGGGGGGGSSSESLDGGGGGGGSPSPSPPLVGANDGGVGLNVALEGMYVGANDGTDVGPTVAPGGPQQSEHWQFASIVIAHVHPSNRNRPQVQLH